MSTVVLSIFRNVTTIALRSADLYLDLVFFFRQGERTVAPTRRVVFSPELREQVRQRQGRKCIYCGVTLNRTNFQVDHVFPVEFGGSNEESNLQATCGSCNSRKGVQTDKEFRERYAAVLPPNRQPPATRIPQARFTAITQRTTQAESTRARRRAVYVPPSTKIVGGSLIGGGIVWLVWFILFSSLFGSFGTIAEQVSMYSGLCVGVGTVVGLIWRGRVTGRMNDV